MKAPPGDPVDRLQRRIDFEDKPCPKCGAPLAYGFGLMGGGYGSYELCDAPGCDYFYKEQDPDDG